MKRRASPLPRTPPVDEENPWAGGEAATEKTLAGTGGGPGPPGPSLQQRSLQFPIGAQRRGPQFPQARRGEAAARRAGRASAAHSGAPRRQGPDGCRRVAGPTSVGTASGPGQPLCEFPGRLLVVLTWRLGLRPRVLTDLCQWRDVGRGAASAVRTLFMVHQLIQMSLSALGGRRWEGGRSHSFRTRETIHSFL